VIKHVFRAAVTVMLKMDAHLLPERWYTATKLHGATTQRATHTVVKNLKSYKYTPMRNKETATTEQLNSNN
jgi:hypothetical protein